MIDIGITQRCLEDQIEILCIKRSDFDFFDFFPICLSVSFNRFVPSICSLTVQEFSLVLSWPGCLVILGYITGRASARCNSNAHATQRTANAVQGIQNVDCVTVMP